MSKDAEARAEMIKLTGRNAVPVIVVDNDIIVGFNEARLEEILGAKPKAPDAPAEAPPQK